MICINCGGYVLKRDEIIFRAPGCLHGQVVIYCRKCGAIHLCGVLAKNTENKTAFLENGQIVYK